jgi:hypothetical protein
VEKPAVQTVQRLADIELAQPRVLDDLVDVALAVDQREDQTLGLVECRVADRDPIAVHDEDQVE